MQQTLPQDSKEKERKQAAEFQNQKLQQIEAQKLEQAYDDKSKDRDFQVNKFDVLAKLSQEILEQCLSELSLDDMSISALVHASDNIFEYHRQFCVASCDFLGKEYSDVQQHKSHVEEMNIFQNGCRLSLSPQLGAGYDKSNIM